MERAHKYQSNLIWTGNIGQGTSGYQNYTRDYTIQINGKVDMAGSADAAFRGPDLSDLVRSDYFRNNFFQLSGHCGSHFYFFFCYFI